MSASHFFRAAREGREEAFRLMRSDPRLVNAKDSCGGWTALLLAAKGGHLDLVCALLEWGAAVNATNDYGASPLCWASCGGHLSVVDRLLKHGATPNHGDLFGTTPLITASRHNRLDVMECLIRYGADIDAQDKDGQTALWRVSCWGKLAVVRLLLVHGADWSIPDKLGRTACDVAADLERLDCVCVLQAAERAYSLHRARCLYEAAVTVSRHVPAYIAGRYGPSCLRRARDGSDGDCAENFALEGDILQAECSGIRSGVLCPRASSMPSRLRPLPLVQIAGRDAACHTGEYGEEDGALAGPELLVLVTKFVIETMPTDLVTELAAMVDHSPMWVMG